jgi:gliding motility-associated-like protein
MKKASVLLLILYLSISYSSAQIYRGSTTLSSFTNEAIDVESDAAGNLYVAGYFSGGTSFVLGAPQVNSQGNTDIYVSKFNSSGTLIWVKTFGGSFSDKPTDLAIDNLGNIIVTGQYFGQVNFGGTILSSANSSKDIFLVKMDPSGTVLWATTEGGIGSENALGVTVDALNNIVLTGQYLGSSVIAAQTLTSVVDPTTGTSNYDMFVSKYSSSGMAQWVKTGTAKYAERGFAVATDSQNNIFITGQFSDTLTLAGTVFNNTSNNVGLIAKFSTSGTLLWMNTLIAGSVSPYDLEINSLDEPVIVGDFLGTMIYTAGASTTTITAPDSKKIFALKISNSGTHIWNKTSSSLSDLSARAISIDASNNIYLTGYFKCGWTEFQTLPNPQSTFNSVGFRDAYLMSVSNLGVINYVKTFGSKENDEGSGIAFDSGERPVICGSHTENLNIPITTVITDYQGTASPFDFSLILGSPTTMGHAILDGDLTTNSFLTNAVHSGTPDYVYYYNLPLDSIQGNLIPLTDTVYFCIQTTLQYNPKTSDSYGPDYSYLWNNGSTENPLDISQTGMYIVTVQRKDGCVSTKDTIYGVLNPTPPIPLMTDNLGIAVGAPSYPSYQLCYPDTVTIWYNNLCAGCSILIGPTGVTDTLPHIYTQGGPYVVTVSNGLCTNSGEFWIVMDSIQPFTPIEPYLFFIEDPDQNDTITICYGDTLEVHAYDSIGNPLLPIIGQFLTQPIDYYYFSNTPSDLPYSGIGDGVFNYHFRPDTAGWFVINYLIIIGFDNECGLDTLQYTISDSIYISMPPRLNPNIIISAEDSLCPSSTTYLTATPAFSNFVWSGPNVAFVTPGNDSAQVTQAGTYHYTGMLLDSLTGCITDLDYIYELIEKQAPSILLNPIDGVICPGDSIIMTVPNIYTTYNWLDPNGNSPSSTNSLISDIPGFYFCNVVDSNGCTLTSTPAELTQFTIPGLTVSPQSILCENEPVFILATFVGSPVITWINPASAGNATELTANLPGTYICQIEQCGITTIDSVQIIDGTFTITLTATDTVLCYGDTAFLSVDPGYDSYSWVHNSDMINTNTATTSGYYSVAVTNQFGCIQYSDTLTILSAPFAYLTAVEDTTLCYGESVTLIDNGFTPVFWYNQDTNFLASAPTYTTPPLFQSTTVYSAYNSPGCPQAFQQINITVIPELINPQIIGNTILCPGDSSILTLNPSQLYGDWYINNIFISNDTFITAYASSAIPNQLIKLIISNNCFSDSVFQQITSVQSPVLNLGSDTLRICGNNTQTLQANSGLDSLLWTTSTTTLFANQIIIDSTFPNNNYIFAFGEDSNGCASNLDSVLVLVSDPLQIDISVSPTICLEDVVILSATTNSNIVTWSGPFGIVNNHVFSFTLNGNEGTYIVKAIDSIGCVWTNSVDIFATGANHYGFPDTIDCFTDWLNVQIATGEFDFTFPVDILIDTLTMTDNMNYTITSSNSFGCEVTYTLFVIKVICDLTIPNVITPNGDGINDFFLIDYAHKRLNDRLLILNRWGNVVYESENSDNGWDGGDLHDGVYTYLYYTDTKDSSASIEHGFVHITR